MALHIKDIDDVQADFQVGTLTDVEAAAENYLQLAWGGEIGSITTTDTSSNSFAYDTVDLSRSYENPIVIALMTTYNGADPSIARINNVTADSFDVGIAEAQQEEGIDDGHNSEKVSYFVLENRGHYKAFDNRTIEVGTINLTDVSTYEASGTTIPWTSISFSTSFASAPIVLAQVQTENNGYKFLKCRITSVTKDGFDVVLERHGNNSTATLTNAETVAWVAIEQGAGTKVDVGTFTVAGDLDATTIWDTLSYGLTFSSAPVFVAQDQTTAGLDACEIRCRNNSTSSIDLTCEEDDTFDVELGHASETVGYIAFEPGFIWYENSGNRLSPQLDLSAAGTVKDSLINWNSSINVLDFDGINDIVTTSKTPPSPITLEAWIKLDTIPSERGFIFRSNAAVYFSIETTRKLRFFVYTTGGECNELHSTIVLNTNQWYHVAASWDGTTDANSQKLYIDGQLDNSNVASGTSYDEGISSFTIGAQSTTSSRFNGKISDARIWNSVRTQTEIENNMYKRLTGDETNLVGYWPFIAGSGTTAKDYAGSNDGTITGATWTTDTLPNGLDILIETRVSINDGTDWTTWTACTNGGAIPNLSAETDVSTGLLECKQTLSTINPIVTPKLKDLTLQINSQKFHGASLNVDSQSSFRSVRAEKILFLNANVQTIITSLALQKTQDILIDVFTEISNLILERSIFVLLTNTSILEGTIQRVINPTVNCIVDNLQVSLQQYMLDVVLKAAPEYLLMGALQRGIRPSIVDWRRDVKSFIAWTKKNPPSTINWQKINKG
jgi:hypothetical protein